MRIYKMTATFGKLENQTLTLEPGLNIITAPNEWGKSTWCAFLVAMLYGMDTRVKTTKTALADKERYAPWSGAPMEGRVDLCWQGRDITIERRTKRRVPLGEFLAYETASGLPVEELNASNCGQMLLGVEQSVFRRAGFIRHADLPVTQDEALRRRLNALVTTGDESGAADKLAANLKDLKNRCRFNRTGLLPQAEKAREEVAAKLEELSALENQSEKLKQRLEEVKDWSGQLENHRQTMEYVASQANASRREQAGTALAQVEEHFRGLEEDCEKLPSREEAEQKIQALRSFREQWSSIQMERELLPERPEIPEMLPPFTGMTPAEARKMARQEGEAFASARSAKTPGFLIALGLVGLLGVGLLVYLKVYVPALVAFCAAAAAFLWSFRERSLLRRQREHLLQKYGTPHWKHWADPILKYEAQLQRYQEALEVYEDSSSGLESRYQVLKKQRDSLCGSQEPEIVLEFWQQVQEKWDQYHTVRRELGRAKNHYEDLCALDKPVAAPTQPDTLTYSEADTARLLSDSGAEQQRLLGRLGQYQGRMEALGSREILEGTLEGQNRRIAQLEDTYSALSIALETLADARAELQRRFAPRITRRAQGLLSRMTDGRYHSLTMGEDFTLRAGAGEESTLREGLWRSDGTMDQLYLSLRLAVASELTPEAPLILDDALVRFDDERMEAAVAILREMAEEKQVILFTCQGREAEV